MDGPLRVRVLGSFEIEGADVRALRSRKARTVLKVLALARGQAVSPDRLIDALWADDPPAQPERELAVNVSRARQLVGAERIDRDDAGYRLAVDWLDLASVEEMADEARRRRDEGALSRAGTAAVAALALVRGPLLADEPDATWAEGHRASVERLLAELRSTAAEAALASGSPGEAVSLAESALDHDPYDESALRILMRAHVAAGRPASALASYASTRSRLAEDLGSSPTAETEELHDAIVREEELPGAVAASDRVSAAVPPPALVGRASEIATLSEEHGAAAGRLRFVLIDGDPGMGKTRLLETWAAGLRSAGVGVLVGRCDELGRSLPLQPIADALSSFLDGGGRQVAAEILGADEALLGPLLGLVPDPATTAGAISQGPSADLLQAALFAAVLRVLGRVPSAGPVVLVLDDVHLAAPSTVEWLRFAERRAGELSLVVVMARRIGEGADVPADTYLHLSPLDLDAAIELAGGDRARDLLERSGGNALYLVELAAVDEGDELPTSIRAAVASRCDELGAAGPVIRTAAILGPTVDIEVLASVLGRPTLDVLNALEDGLRRGLLEERAGRFEFRHTLVREALTGDSLEARQVLVHREAARILASRPDADPLEVAYHARRGDDPVLAARALIDASAVAAGRFDLVEAERLLDDAVELDDSADARVARGRIRLAAGDSDGAEDDGRAASSLGGGAPALLLRAWVARTLHGNEAAVALGEQALALATTDGVRADTLVLVGWVHRGLGQLREAERELEAAGELRVDDPMWRAAMGLLRVNQGRAQEALDLFEPLQMGGPGFAHGFQVEHVLQATAHALAMRGRVVEALELAAQLGDELVKRGSEWRYGGVSSNYRAWILRNLRHPEADECNAAALEEGSQPEIHTQGMIDLAAGRIDRGELGDAATLLDEADERVRITVFNNRWRCQQRSALQRSRLLLVADEVDAALEAATSLARDAHERGDARYATMGRLLVARARARSGEAVDLEAVSTDLDALAAVAGLEAWWLTADVARDVGEDRFLDLARSRARELAANAGAYAADFESAASAYLDP